MKKPDKKIRLIYPQWQGGLISSFVPELPSKDVDLGYNLGSSILSMLSPATDGEVVKVPISTTRGERVAEDGIIDCGIIKKQTAAALDELRASSPDRIVTFGGECSVSVVPFTYLADRYKDDVAVIWIDAHPDLNLPYDEYPAYHAMALSACLGIGDSHLMSILPGMINPENVLIAGLRSWEKNTKERQHKLGIAGISPAEMSEDNRAVLDWLKSKGKRKVLVHFDLDVLDPEETVAAVAAVPNGLRIKQVVDLINSIDAEYDLVGLTIAEPMPRNEIKLKNLLKELPLLNGDNLPATLRFVYPQWQGGSSSNYLSLPELSKESATTGYYWGSELLNFLSPSLQPAVRLPVSLDTDNRSTTHGIASYDAVVHQTKEALDFLQVKAPQRIVTLGGDCSVSVVPYTYLAKKYQGDIALVWIDAHPDICLPGDQLDGYDAMALTACLGMGDKSIMDILPAKADPSKTLTVGVRAWSTLGPGIEDRQKKLGIKNVPVQKVSANSDIVLNWLKESGVTKVFIHFDLDVLEPTEITAAVSTDPDGLKSWEAIRLINDIAKKYDLVGMTLAEPMPRTAIQMKDMMSKIKFLQ